MWLGHGELSDGVVVYLAFEFRHRPLHREKGEEVCVEKGEVRIPVEIER